MTVLAADKASKTKTGRIYSYPVDGGSLIFKGALVVVNAAGFLEPAADAAAKSSVVGIAFEQADNVSGSDGDISVRVIADVRVVMAATAITAAMIGDTMHVVDDATVDDAVGTNGVVAGTLVEFLSATEGMIYIPHPVSPAAPVGGNFLFATTVTALTVVDGVVTFVDGT